MQLLHSLEHNGSWLSIKVLMKSNIKYSSIYLNHTASAISTFSGGEELFFSFIANPFLTIFCVTENIAHRWHRYTCQDLSTSEYARVLFIWIATCDHDNSFHSCPLSDSSDSSLPACMLRIQSLRLHWIASCWCPHFRRPAPIPTIPCHLMPSEMHVVQ